MTSVDESLSKFMFISFTIYSAQKSLIILLLRVTITLYPHHHLHVIIQKSLVI